MAARAIFSFRPGGARCILWGMEGLVFHSDETAPRFTTDLGTARNRGLVLYTDAFVIRGTLRTIARRLSDALNQADEGFFVLEDVTFEAHGAGVQPEHADYAQVNLSTVLFAHEPGDTVATPPELRTVKVAQPALVSLPPFRVVGDIHVLPERDLRDALHELVGRFVPITGATFWSDTLAIPRTTVSMLAFNHERSQILAPYAGPDLSD
jgi:hypothetical protein